MSHDWMNDSDKIIRPTTNETQEIVRWLPPGVKQLFLRIDPTDDLTNIAPALTTWMDKKNLLTRPTKGHHRGKTILSTLGTKAHKSLQRRLNGQEGT